MLDNENEREILEDVIEEQAEQDIASDAEDDTLDSQMREDLLEEAPIRFTGEGDESEGSVDASSDEVEADGGADSSDDSDVDLDEIADTAIEVLQTILKPFDIGDITIDEYDGDEGELILDITGDDLAVLIGRHGRTLESMQFLVSAIVRRKLGYRYPVVVDVEGYKSRQRQKIESIAKSAANRAASQGRDVAMRPMTPYERRLVHIALRDDDRVETESEGEGSERHVVVIPR